MVQQLLRVHQHKAALALDGVDHTGLTEKAHGLPHRDAADTHHLHELFFTGQQIALFVNTLLDHAADPFHDLLVKPLSG